jgi:hypothetical protein
VRTAASAFFTSPLAECAAASEMAEMAEVNSLLTRWVYSRKSSHSSGEGRSEDEISFDRLMGHLAKIYALNITEGERERLKPFAVFVSIIAHFPSERSEPMQSGNGPIPGEFAGRLSDRST